MGGQVKRQNAHKWHWLKPGRTVFVRDGNLGNPYEARVMHISVSPSLKHQPTNTTFESVHLCIWMKLQR